MYCKIIILLIVLLAILFPLSFSFPFLFHLVFLVLLLFFYVLWELCTICFGCIQPPHTQLLSNSIPLPYPPNFTFFKKKSFKTKLCCSNIFGCVVCHQKLQDYLDSYSLKEDRLSLSQNLPTVCSSPLSTVGFVLTRIGLVYAVSTAVSSCV